MGRIRKQAAGVLLPAHHSRQAQVAIRSRALESDDCGYCRDIADNSRGSMNMWTRFRSWTAAMLCRNRKERDMDEEMRFHIEAHAADLVGRGVAQQEALRQARLEF